jgi:hypothetical protein
VECKSKKKTMTSPVAERDWAFLFSYLGSQFDDYPKSTGVFSTRHAFKAPQLKQEPLIEATR